MKIIIKLDICDDTEGIIIKNRLKEWLIDNFQEGARSEIEIERPD